MTVKNAPSRLAWLIGLCLLVVMAGAAAALWLALPPARIRALVQGQLAVRLDREVRLGAVTLALLPPVRATVEDVALAEPGGFARGAAAQVRRLELDLDPFGLLAGRVVVRRLALREPSLRLALLPGGRTNLEGLARPPAAARAPGPRLDLDVGEFRIQGGRVLVDDLARRRRRVFTLDQRLSFRTARRGERLSTEGESRLSGYAFGSTAATRLSELDRGLAGLEVRLLHRGQYDARQRRLALERLEVGVGKASLSMVGLVDSLGGAARVSLQAKGAGVDLGEVLDALGRARVARLEGVRGGGTLTFDVRVVGPLSAARLPAVTGTVRVAGGRFQFPGAPAGVTDLSATAALTADEMRVADLRARVAGQPLAGDLTVSRLADPYLRLRVRGDVDLAALGPAIAGTGAKLSGRTALDVTAAGRLREPAAMRVSGSARLRDVAVESPALPKRVEHVSGEVGFSEARAQVRALALSAGRSSLRLDATVDRPMALLARGRPGAAAVATGGPPAAPAQVDFSLVSPYLDLADLVRPGGGALPALNARGGGSVRVDRFRSERLEATDLRARLALEPGVVRAEEFSLRAYGGRVAGDASLDARDRARPRYRVRARVDSLQADAVLSAWTPARGVLTGVLRGDLDLAAEGVDAPALQRTLTALGAANVLGGRLGVARPLEELAKATAIPQLAELGFRDLRVPFRVEHGRIFTDDVRLAGPLGEWRMAGTLGFDGSLDYALSATLPPEVAARLPQAAALAAGALGDGHGLVLLDLKLTGSARAPRFAWDAGAMRARLAGRLTDALVGQRSMMQRQARAADDSARAAALALERAAADSARAAARRARRSLEDSLRARGSQWLKSFFGAEKDSGR